MLYFDKILAQLAYPLNLSLCLALIAVILLWRGRRAGLPVLALALCWLWFWSTPVVSKALWLSLEDRFEDTTLADLQTAEAIVVLGGSLRPAMPPRFMHPDLYGAADRIWHTARLYREGKAPRVVISGGNLPWLGKRQPEAEAIRSVLIEWGVAPESIIIEGKSQSTRENAVYTAELLSGLVRGRVLLVTSAVHMQRALAAFKAVGVDAVPAPTDFQSVPEDSHLLQWLPDAGALLGSSVAIKEYLGLWVYRWRGWA